MADHETQSWPLAPSRAHQRSDEENPALKSLRRERNNKCFVYIFSAIVLQSIVLFIFALIALRPKSPRVNIRFVHVKTLHYSPSSFNATLVAELSVQNPNFGPYSFEGNNSAVILYGGERVGEKRLKSGRASTKGIKRVNVTIDIRSNRLPQGQNSLSQDIGYGIIRLKSFSKFSGKVRLIGVFKNRRESFVNCTMSLVLRAKRVQDLRCHS